MSELKELIDKEIPEGRQHLQENFSNLEQVAQYCQKNYLQATDKRKALEETKNYTTHSLASVAYQINNLATNFLKLLDLQQNQLAEMESNVNHLAQTVNIHKEKVARREIGVLTTNRSTTRPLGVKNGIIFPEHGERPTRYQRKNIDYSSLDDIGHGVKGHQPSTNRPAPSSAPSTPAPSQQPPTPPQMRGSGGSIGKAQGLQMQQGPYRTPAPAVAPPTVPSNYASMQQMQRDREQQLPQHPSQQQQRGSITYAPSTPPVMMGAARMPPGMMSHPLGPGAHQQQQLPVGMARPMSAQGDFPPPAPPMMMGDRTSQMGDRTSQMGDRARQMSIDLPPPPMSPDEESIRESQNISFDEGSPPPPPPPQFVDDEPDLPPQEEDPYAATGPDMFTNIAPAEYLEKVIAIFDYDADKDDELSFSENSVIFVVKKNDDGWFEGMLNGQTGLFPGNYVEPCL